MLTNILIQSLLIMLTMMVYQAYFRHHATTPRLRKIIFAILCLFGVAASFYYPISVANGYKIDLRIIPFLLAFTYGGIATGSLVALFIIGITYWLGLIGFKIDLAIFVVLIPFLAATYKRYHTYSFKQKISYLFSFMLAFLFMTIIGVELSLPYDQKSGFAIWILFAGLNMLTLLVVVYIKESMHELELMNIALQEKEKMTVVGELAATLIHEVKNPLTTIKGFLQIISHSENLSEREKNYISIIMMELNQTNEIITDYLSIARSNREIKTEVIDINTEVKHVKDLVNSLALAKAVDIYVNILDDKLEVKGSKNEIRQVLTNIVKNSVEAIEGHHGVLKINTYQTLYNVVIEIIDNGKGMSKEQLKNLGKTFFTTKANGTGLGMMVSNRIVQSMGGAIDVKSKQGDGSKFVISLPKYIEKEHLITHSVNETNHHLNS